MKKQPSVGAAPETHLFNVHRAFLPRLTESTADRWIKATTRLFLSLNGEENGTLSPSTTSSGVNSVVKYAAKTVVTERDCEWQVAWYMPILPVRYSTEIQEISPISPANCNK